MQSRRQPVSSTSFKTLSLAMNTIWVGVVAGTVDGVGPTVAR